jgi:putative peptide zinc metalloprotease protein
MSAESTTAAPPAWLSQPVELAPHVTLIDGADGHSLLFNAATGTYVRLSRTGAHVVPLLDGTRTGTALLDAASRSRGPDGTRDRGPAMLTFLNDLRAAGVLSEPPEPLRGTRRWLLRIVALTPRVRVPARHLNLLLRRPAMLLARFPRAATAVGLVAAVAAVAAVVLAVVLPAPLVFAGPPWLLIIGALLVQAAVHEMGHATVCQALNVPVREAGVRLFFWLLPLTYVDRTDAYRVRSRAGRSAVALVGPLVDLIAAGLTGLLIVVSPVRFGELRWLLGMQLFLAINNLNPLLPVTDGHHAMEAALGELNLRSRAFTYLGHILFGIPLPTAHRSVPPARRGIYLTYGFISVGYLGLVLALVAMTYYRLILQAAN